MEAQELWDEFTEKKYQLFKKTHKKDSKWYVIRSNDKHLARLETMKLILNLVPYRGRSRSLNFLVDPKIVIPGDRELEIMKKQKEKHGKLLE